ncbi:MAG TPA: hypothetical protein VN946_11110 [Terriglobales bacterium]|jgi:hypothetical protein|nr:hypothetical protein [Terriglobales bacterium]
MKASFGKLAVTFVALAVALLLVPTSFAQCGGVRQLQPQHPSMTSPGDGKGQPGRPHFMQAGFVTISDSQDDGTGIVGFWHVKFVSEGSQGIPDGTEVDAGYSQWHSDGTEVMNSGGRSPITGNFCLGVWKSLGNSKYRLNHFSAAWDSTGSNLIGPANIKESITLAPSGNAFAGTFTIDVYDEAGNNLAHVQGKITGTRIDVYTKEQSIF